MLANHTIHRDAHFEPADELRLDNKRKRVDVTALKPYAIEDAERPDKGKSFVRRSSEESSF